MSKTAINVGAASGLPYNAAIKTDGLLFVSGQLPTDPETGGFPEDITGQTAQSLANLKAVLEAAGTSTEKVVKTTVFLSDIENFAAMNEVYSKFFAGSDYPARSAFAVAALPKGALVEIEAIATVD